MNSSINLIKCTKNLRSFHHGSKNDIWLKKTEKYDIQLRLKCKHSILDESDRIHYGKRNYKLTKPIFY